jgi:hypothetical protein
VGDALRILVWSSPWRMTSVELGACSQAKVVNSVGRLDGRNTEIWLIEAESRQTSQTERRKDVLQVKVGRHPHEREVCRQSGALRDGVRPHRALEAKLPGLRVDDVQGIALCD